MKREYIYYAHKVGQEDWTEDIICVLDQPISDAQKAKLFPVIQADGYDLNSFRESVFDGSAPDFTRVLNTQNAK